MLAQKGGKILAISVDPPELSREVVERDGLQFPILSDVERSAIRAYGVEHEGGLGNESIAVPAQILVRPDGTIAWTHVARRITDRAYPSATLEAVRGL